MTMTSLKISLSGNDYLIPHTTLKPFSLNIKPDTQIVTVDDLTPSISVLWDRAVAVQKAVINKSGEQFRPEAPEPFFLVEGEVDLEEQTITLEDTGEVLSITKDLIGDAINPAFIEQAESIVEVSANLTDEQKLIAEFWEDGTGTSFPPGTWMTFGEFVSARDDHTLDEDAQLFLALGNAVFDAGIATWEAKTFYGYVYVDSLNDVVFEAANDDLDILYGGNGNDYVHGGEGDNLVFGFDGNDLFYVGPGNDPLDGQNGNDFLDGGDGVQFNCNFKKKELFNYLTRDLFKSKNKNNYSRGSPILSNVFKRDTLRDGVVGIMNRIFNELTLSIQQFNISVSKIFPKKNPEGAKLWRFTEIKLKQFNLAKAYEPQEILTIAYERSVKAIREGKYINSKSIIPWFKSLSYNIIRELRRERDKDSINRKDIPDDEIADLNNPSENLFWEENPYRVKYEKLMEYLKTLPYLEQELFKLRAEQGLPWKEIAHNLSEQDFEIVSEQALRKKYSRLTAKFKVHNQLVLVDY